MVEITDLQDGTVHQRHLDQIQTHQRTQERPSDDKNQGVEPLRRSARITPVTALPNEREESCDEFPTS